QTTNTVGMLWIWNACESRGFASLSTVASTQAPSASPASFSSSGDSCLQGPHHSAQKSMTTGTANDLSTTSAWKVASVTTVTGGGVTTSPAAAALAASAIAASAFSLAARCAASAP